MLLSGGMDSIALMWWCKPDLAITIDYGQRPAAAEITASTQVCEALGVPHQVLSVDTSALGSGDLAGGDALPEAPASDWWPFRNQLLITLAGACALKHSCNRLLIGTVASDATHLDGTPEFVQLISALMTHQEGRLTVEAPAILLSTEQLIRRSNVPAELMAWAHSCHKANYPCCACRGCYKHHEVLEQLGGGFYALP